MSDKKTININPALFQFGSGKTRKKKEHTKGPKEIKVKNALTRPNKTTKGKVLRYIREQQEKNFKEMFDNSISKNAKLQGALKEPLVESPKSDFEDSVNYLTSIVEEEDKKKSNHLHNNTTIRNRPISDSSFFESILSEHPSVSNSLNDNNVIYQSQNIINEIVPSNNQVLTDFRLNPRMVLPEPKYGCLKNGKLPTYRMMMNQTMKNNRPYANNNNISIVNTSSSQNPAKSHSAKSHSAKSHSAPSYPAIVSSTPIVSCPLFTDPLQGNTNPANIEERMKNEKLKNMSEMKQLRELIKKKATVVPKNMKYLKQKKTVKRTHYLGKSKVHPKVAVLVSNRTLRKKITTQAQLLKQVPIHDVKKYLIKNGFIKVGSVAPNDVMRKMYESAVLVGGEIQNHNSENLLYNYLNAEPNTY